MNEEMQNHDIVEENDWLEDEDNLKPQCKRKCYEVPVSDTDLEYPQDSNLFHMKIIQFIT